MGTRFGSLLDRRSLALLDGVCVHMQRVEDSGLVALHYILFYAYAVYRV